MKIFKVAVFGALLLIASRGAMFAQQGGLVFIPPITPGDCAKWLAANILQDSGGVCGGGGGGSPGGSSGQVQYNNAGSFGGITGATTNGTALTLVAPVLGTPASGTLTNTTGLPISTGVSGLGTGVANALGVNVGSAGAPVVNGGALGTPSSGVGTNLTGIPIGALTGLGTGVGTALGAAVSGSGAICLVSGSACDTSGAGGTSGYSDNGVTVTAGTYYAPITGGGAPQSTEASVDVASPVAMTVTDLQTAISATLGAASTGFTVTLRDNGSDTALTCTFNPSAATSCSDLTHSVGVSLGDLIDWKIVTAGTIVGAPTITIASSQGTSTNLLGTANVWTAQQSNAITTLSISTATFTPTGASNNYKMTLIHASCPCTLANPSATPVAGTSGIIEVIQSATGSDTIGTWGSQYISAGGTSTITLSTGANAQDYIAYYVVDSTHVLLSTGALNASH